LSDTKNIRGVHRQPSFNKACKEWTSQADKDRLLLKDRIFQCEKMSKRIKGKFEKALIRSDLIKKKDFLFGGIKGLHRCLTKLDEYIGEESKRSGSQQSQL